MFRQIGLEPLQRYLEMVHFQDQQWHPGRNQQSIDHCIRNVTAVGLANLADQACFGHGTVSLLMQDSIIQATMARARGHRTVKNLINMIYLLDGILEFSSNPHETTRDRLSNGPTIP